MVHSITLQTSDPTITDNDILGQISFAAPNETGADALLISASIFARAEAAFDADENATELVFVTSASESSSPGTTNGDMTLSSAGNLILAGTITGATSITSTTFVGALTGNASGTALTVTQAAQSAITSLGTLTSVVVADGGNIGSASDTDAISIAATGKITYGAGSVPKTSAGGTSGDVDLNANLSNYFTIAAAGTLNILIQNAEVGQRILLRIVTGGHGANITWDAAITLTWPAGTAPTFTTNGTDVIGLLCTATNTFDGFIIGQNIS